MQEDDRLDGAWSDPRRDDDGAPRNCLVVERDDAISTSSFLPSSTLLLRLPEITSAFICKRGLVGLEVSLVQR